MRRPLASRFDESMTHSRPQELTETDVLVDAADQASRWTTGRLWRNGSQMRVRRIGSVATAIVILFSLCGCGSESSGADSQPPSKTPSPGRTDGPTAVPRGAERDPFHIGDAAWPVDLEGAAALYDDMPAKFKTRPVERMPMVKGAAGVAYGPGDVGPMAWSMEADKSVPDAQTALAVMFGMTMSCDKIHLPRHGHTRPRRVRAGVRITQEHRPLVVRLPGRRDRGIPESPRLRRRLDQW